MPRAPLGRGRRAESAQHVPEGKNGIRATRGEAQTQKSLLKCHLGLVGTILQQKNSAKEDKDEERGSLVVQLNLDVTDLDGTNSWV